MCRLSIIIPTLNEESEIASTLANVFAVAPESEVIVADGGSADATRHIVGQYPGVRWIDAERGRGSQMNAGASAACGDVLLFLHADTRLPERTPELIRQVMADSRVVGGNFRIRFSPSGFTADFYTLCYNLRSCIRVFYGDSAIFVRRATFDAIGGYRYARLMEDLELVRRLRRAGRIVTIWDGEVISSARRFTSVRQGLRSLALWTWLHILFYCGASQEALERRYPPVR